MSAILKSFLSCLKFLLSFLRISQYGPMQVKIGSAGIGIIGSQPLAFRERESMVQLEPAKEYQRVG